MAKLDRVHDYISELLKNKGDDLPLEFQDSLVSKGRLDSVDVMDIVVFLEEQYGLDFSVRGIDIDDFDSLKAIEKMIGELKK